MKHIVSFSGGIGSFFTTKRLVENYKSENVIMVFCDTNTEDEDLYRFNEDVKNFFKDVEFITLKEGRDIWECAFEDNFLYNSRVANCTIKLKSRVFKKWLKENYKPEECIIHLGFDYQELHRLEKAKKNWLPYIVEAPLIEAPYYSKLDMFEMLEKDYNIKKPRLYTLGFSHNNCGGFCFKAGIGHFKQLYDKMPDRYEYHMEKEKELIKQIKENKGQEVTILKRVRNGEKVNISLEELKKEFQGEQLSLFDLQDIGGCNCFIE